MNADRRAWTLRLALIGVFLAGAVTGVCGSAAYVHHRLGDLHRGGGRALHELGMDWLGRELDLAPEQRRAIETILLDTHMELFRFKARHDDELRAIVLPALERVDALLRPEQLEAWRGLRERVIQHLDAKPPPTADH